MAALMMAALPVWAVDVPQSVDTAFRHYTDLPNMLLPVLEGVKDKESAEKAAPELQKLLAFVFDARRDLGKIDRLSPEVSAEVRRRYEQDMRSRWGKVFDHVYRLQKVKCYKSESFAKQFNTFCMMLEK